MRNHLTKISLGVLAFLVLTAIAVRLNKTDDGVIRIMPFGDSITHGFQGQVSYRRDLWFKLQSEGYKVDFVGNFTKFQSDVPKKLKDFDLDHVGVSGYTVDQMDAKMSSWIRRLDADIVLLHAGTNDLIHGQSISSTLDELASVLEKLRAHNPNIIILLARIIPGRSLDTLPFNIELDNWVVGQNTSDSPIIVVDQYTDFDPFTDNYDNLHPNAAGEAKIANKWFAALQTVLTPVSK